MKNLRSHFKEPLVAFLLALIAPHFALAVVTAPTDLKSFASLVVSMLGGIVGILFASLAVGLVYGVVLYFVHSDNEQKREEVRGYLLWGVIGIFIMVAVIGILQVVTNTFGVSLPR